MANAELILAGLSGALKGGVDDYRWQHDVNERQEQLKETARVHDEEVQRKAALDALNEKERQRQIAAQNEIIEGLPDTNPDGSPNQLKTALRVQYAMPKGNMGAAIVNDAGKDARFAGVSGNVAARNAAALERQRNQINFGYDKTFLEENGRNARWAAPSGNATLGAETTRRGQDIGATTTRRGQDVTAGTARRGQDLSFSLGSDRNATAQRGQDLSFTLGSDRNAIARKKASSLDNLFGVTPSDQAAPVDTADPSAQPSAPVPSTPVSPLPVVPRANTPRPGGAPIPVTSRPAAAPGGGGDPLSVLTAKAEDTLRAFRAEQDPVKKRALAAAMADLKRQRDALLSGGGGGQ